MSSCFLVTAQTTIQTRFDASVMHENPQIATETGMVDDGSGSRKVLFHYYCQLMYFPYKYLVKLTD